MASAGQTRPSLMKRLTWRPKRMLVLLETFARISMFPRVKHPAKHGLPGELILSLTSYPARYDILHYTLMSLLDQTVKPDRTILWIAQSQYDALPSRVLSMQEHGLEIRTCEDIRSYKKIIPVLEQFPGRFVVTADDDLYYEWNWLKKIVTAFDPAKPAIISRRAHRPTRNAAGRMNPYTQWDLQFIMSPGEAPRADLFPTGAGGILYFPGAFSPQVTDREAIAELCPDADDVWLYWMARMQGSLYRQVGGPFREIAWPRSQRTSLKTANFSGGRNDLQIQAMEERYGLY